VTQPAAFSPHIIEIQPCTEEGLVTLEAKLGGSDEQEILDPVLLCRYLNATPVFERPRCSPEMGYGMLEKDGRKIHAFKTGKVIVRRAEGREQALANLRLVSRTIWPAMKVNGGNALVACLASEKGCAVFLAPPADGGQLPLGRPIPEAVEMSRHLPHWRYIEEGIGILRAISVAYPQSGVSKATKEQFRNAEGPIIRFIIEVDESRIAAVGIYFLSVSLALDMAMQACEKQAPELKKTLWCLTVKAFEAAISGSADNGVALKEELAAGGKLPGADMSIPATFLALAGARLPVI